MKYLKIKNVWNRKLKLLSIQKLAKKFRKIGTGLGLHLALQILKAHNGELTVESEEGEYTEFCIKLPA